MDVGLADVEDLGVVTGKDAHNRSGEARTVLSGNPHQNLFKFVV